MTTDNARITPASAYSDVTQWRHVDPLTAETMARYARQEMLAKLARAACKAVTETIARLLRGRAVYQELSELPDHLLNDIGIRRDEVSAIAYGGLTRQASELEQATRQGSLSFFEHRPTAVAAAPRDQAPASDKPLAA